MKTMRLNETGDDVRYLQKLLQEQGFSTKENGIFDITTQQAVIAFQCKAKLTSDGIVGFRTWEALMFENRKTGNSISEEDYRRIGRLMDVDPAVIKAIQEVETGGKGGFFAPGKPAILFEGHIFWHQLKKRGIAPEQYVEGNENILFPQRDKAKYKGGLKEYDRLEQAQKIHKEAANCSASWGMFQIMGFNYAACGMKSIDSFLKAMYEGELSQLRLFILFIMQQKGSTTPDDASKYMISALREKDWANFARIYNGPNYAENKYDVKLEAAYKKYTS